MPQCVNNVIFSKSFVTLSRIKRIIFIYNSNRQKSFTMFCTKKRILSLFIVSCFIAISFAQKPAIKSDDEMKTDSMVQKFYAINHEPLYWYASRKDSKRATEWITAIEAAKESGLISNKLLTSPIRTAMLSKNPRNKRSKKKPQNFLQPYNPMRL